MNRKQREMTVGQVIEGLNGIAQTEAKLVPGESAMSQALRWARVQALLRGIEMVTWGVYQVSAWLEHDDD